jgi:hypothetical protein
MKKLSAISDQIKNNTFSYTGKGSFEAIVNKHKDEVLGWLEDLIPLQKQIEALDEMENVSFQKRNYTRILTKLFPDQYKEFVSLNILVRDSNQIAVEYRQNYNISSLYNALIEKKLLKYPGKYDIYVEFNIFQKFIMTYKDDLIKSINDQLDTKEAPKAEYVYEEPVEKLEILESIKGEKKEEQPPRENPEIQENEQEALTAVREEEEKRKEEKKEKNTNWTNLLLGKLK